MDFNGFRFRIILLTISLTSTISNGRISDLRLCGDTECNVPVALGRTVIRYTSNDPLVLSFNINSYVKIFSKSAGSNQDLWGGEINNRRGYFPKNFIREEKVLIKDLKYTVPTELQATQEVISTESKNEQENATIEAVTTAAHQETSETVTTVAHQEKATETVTTVAHQETSETLTTVAHQETSETVTTVAHQEKATESLATVAHQEEAIEAVTTIVHQDETTEAVTTVAHQEETTTQQSTQDSSLLSTLAETGTTKIDVPSMTEDEITSVEKPDPGKYEQFLQTALKGIQSVASFTNEFPKSLNTLSSSFIKSMFISAESINSESEYSKLYTDDSLADDNFPTESDINPTSTQTESMTTATPDNEFESSSSTIELSSSINSLEFNAVYESSTPSLVENTLTDSAEESYENDDSATASSEILDELDSEETEDPVETSTSIDNVTELNDETNTVVDDNVSKNNKNLEEVIDNTKETFTIEKEELKDDVESLTSSFKSAIFGNSDVDPSVTKEYSTVTEKIEKVDYISAANKKFEENKFKLGVTRNSLLTYVQIIHDNMDLNFCPKMAIDLPLRTQPLEVKKLPVTFEEHSEKLQQMRDLPVDVPENFPEKLEEKSLNTSPEIGDSKLLDHLPDKAEEIFPEKLKEEIVIETEDGISITIMAWVHFAMEMIPTLIPDYLKELILEQMDKSLSVRIFVLLVLTGLGLTLIFWIYIISKVRRKEHKLVAQLCNKEKLLFDSTTERDILKEDVNSANNKIFELEKNLAKAKVSFSATNEDFIQLQEENAAHVSSIESLTEQIKELENSEMQLNSSLEEKTIKYANLKEENEKAIQKIEDLTEEIEKLEDEMKLQKQFRLEDGEQIETLKNQVEELDQTKAQLLNEAQVWNERVTELQQRNETLYQTNEEFRIKLTAKQEESKMLKETLEQLKLLDEDDANENTKQEKLQQLLDAAAVQLKLRSALQEKEELQDELNTSLNKLKLLEADLNNISLENEKLKERGEELQRERSDAVVKLEVLSGYFKQKELELQRELGVQEAMRQQTEESALTVTEKASLYEQEVLLHKSHLDALKKEMDNQARSFKAQIAQHENKAHENWIAARAAERKAEEAKQTAALLRNKLTLAEQEREVLSRMHADGTAAPRRFAGSNGEVPSPPRFEPDFKELGQSGPSSLIREPLDLSVRMPFLPMDRPLPPPPLGLPPPPPQFFGDQLPPPMFDMQGGFIPPHMLPFDQRMQPPPPMGDGRILPPERHPTPPRDFFPSGMRRPPSGHRYSPPYQFSERHGEMDNYRESSPLPPRLLDRSKQGQGTMSKMPPKPH